MGTHSSERWVLAFDASCGRCRKLAGLVHEAPWAPTLLRVRGGDGVGDSTVRAWTGPGMALLRRLGVRSTVRLSRALGDLRAAAGAGDGIGRQRFLRIGAGVAA